MENLLDRIKSGKGKPASSLDSCPILLPVKKTSTEFEPGKSYYAKIPALTEKEVIEARFGWVYPRQTTSNHGVIIPAW